MPKEMMPKVQSRLDAFNSLLIPPFLVVLLTFSIAELFFPSPLIFTLTYIIDIFVILIFGIDLIYRFKESKNTAAFLKNYWIDIIATIPLALIVGPQASGTELSRGLKFLGRGRRFLRPQYLRLLRVALRGPRFLHNKRTKGAKSVKRISKHEKEMKGTLSFKVILLITINSIMGTGIWFLTSVGAEQAGPASLISWVVLSIISIYISMCFAELVSMFPKAGGVYEFAKQAYGRFWSFVIGWTTSIAGSVTIAMLLLGALQYLIPIEYAYTYIPIAIALIVVFSYVAYRGMQTSTVVLVSFALITLGAVTAIIIPGLINFNPSNLDPFFVLPTMNIVLAIFFIAETFFGWESAIFLSAETKNPRKVMPKALIYGTIVIAVLSFLLAFTAMGTIPWQEYAQSVAPLRDLGTVHFGAIGGATFAFLIFVSVIGATAGWIVTAPRLLMSIAEDKLFFIHFAKIHPRHKSPHVSILFQVLIVSTLVIVGAGSYETLLHMLIPLIIILYSSVLLAVVILRFKKPHLKRAYKVAGGKFLPILTIGFMIFLLVTFIFETHSALDILRISVGLVLFGLPAYMFIELFYESRYVAMRRGFTAKLRRRFHYAPKPRPSFRKIVSLTGPYTKNTVVIDSNSPVGVISHYLHLRKLPFKNHHIFCSSEEELKHLNEFIKGSNRGKRVKAHKINLGNLPKSVPKADVFISYNDLGHVRDFATYLTKVKASLKRKGRFCFYIHHTPLSFSPNTLLLDNRDEVLTLFEQAGLKAKFSKRKMLFQEEIYIWGTK